MIELIRQAASRLDGVVPRTPLIHSSTFSRLFGFEVWLKLENLQKTGSFKVRGAFNRISALSDGERKGGVIAASSGNHGQGVAWASALLGVSSTVVMPESAPIVKAMAARGYGAEVISAGKDFNEAYLYALALAKERRSAFIHPFDDDLVIAGQGTIGLEIIEEMPDLDAVVVPVGGGGLISGIAVAVKASGRPVTVIGAEAGAVGACSKALASGGPVEVAQSPSIADGIAVKKVGTRTFGLIRSHVDSVVSVGEDSIAGAILLLLERKKLMVEGAGAVPIAAAMEGQLPVGIKKAVFVVSGGNIDVTMLDRVIRLGLVREGRLLRLATVISDTPGALAGLTAVIASLKANILHVRHQREAVDVPVGCAKIELVLEVEGPGQSELILRELKRKGYELAVA